jgi:amino acid adenylation domain-containing protein
MLVGVCLDRCHDMIAGLLGILKAGCAYVPLEPAMPAERIAVVVESAGIAAILTHEHYAAMARHPGVTTIVLDQDGGRMLPDEDGGNLPCIARPDNLAYVIYTSGSTGRPKGVAVTHRPAINLFEWVYRTCNFGPQDCVLFTTSLGFDLSVFDIFGMLGCGGSIYIVEDHKRKDAGYLARTLGEEQITFWDSAPAALQLLLPSLRALPQPVKNTSLRQIFLSGDWIPVTLPDDIRAVFPGARVMSLGGATEATVWSNYFPINRVEPHWRSIPYGRPMQNCRYYILDEHLAACPPGVTGDLYIAGKCLSQGYLNEPELTDRSYIPDPFSSIPGERMYRTGDLARYFSDGTIEFLGRSDFQVKVRGYRIELGEIEQVLRRHELIKEAVVTVQQDPGGDQKLVAYLISANGALPAPRELRSYAARYLPDYMVPNLFARMENFPLSPNGKVDRKQLPWPVRQPATEHAAAAPVPSSPDRESLTALLTNYFKEVLAITAISPDDDFFDLGVTSLNLIQIAEKLQQGPRIDISVEVFLDNPSIRAVAAHILKDAPADFHYPDVEQAITSCAMTGDSDLHVAQEPEIRLPSAAPSAQCLQKTRQSGNGAVADILNKIQITLPAEAFADPQVTDDVIAKIRQALAVLNNGHASTAAASLVMSRKSAAGELSGASAAYPLHAEAMPAPAPPPDNTNGLIKSLSGHFTAVLGIAGISPDDDIFDLGVTSLNLIQIAERLQQQNNIAIPVEVFLDHASIRTIAAHLESAAGASTADSIKSGVLPAAEKTERAALAACPSPALQEHAGIHDVIELDLVRFADEAYEGRSCRRSFSSSEMPLRAFAQFLGLLKQEKVQGQEKYLYPSAGGLNAVQTYLYIRKNRVEGLHEGMYYYHPVRHALFPVAAGQSFDPELAHPANREMLDNAGFCIFFIAQLAAIEPVYSTLSTALVTLDAGYMGQLLMGRQQRYAIGLCPVAGIDAAKVRSLFKLDGSHRFVHGLAGGSVNSANQSIGTAKQPDTIAGYIRRTNSRLSGCYAGTALERTSLEAVAAARLGTLNALTDAEHEDLHRRQLHLRRFEQEQTACSLPPVNYLHNEYLLRSTQRSFIQQPIAFNTFSGFMSLLKRETVAGQARYLYPSAGGMYAVQTYMHIKPGAIEQVPEGIYQYHPDLHIMSRICARPAIDIKNAHLPGNRSYYAEAGFSIFLVARLSALQPVFDGESLYLAMLESGYIGQLLMERQAEFNLGVCPIGALRFDLIRPDFRLEDGDRLVHSFLCGPVERNVSLAGHKFLKIL